MGIVNVTPDSFSDGGAFFADDVPDIDAAVAHGIGLMRDGADLLDVGGESTRPGADAVDATTEQTRVVPVVEQLVAAGAIVSIDTTKASVAASAIAAGAAIVNDVTALGDSAMADLCAEADVGVVLMHMRGTPRTMQDDPVYDDVVAEVRRYLEERAEAAIAAGIDAQRIAVDPGIGFGKTLEHNLALLAQLERITELGFPVVLGASRKRFLGVIVGAERPSDRDVATAATTALGIAAGAAVVRVHNVAMGLHAARTADAIVRSARTEETS